tara:strand:- start:49 stop:165 length:117 start_codon:yes stop_codon:yes gene_type:complete
MILATSFLVVLLKLQGGSLADEHIANTAGRGDRPLFGT